MSATTLLLEPMNRQSLNSPVEIFGYKEIIHLTAPKSFSGDFKVPHAHWTYTNCTLALFETGANLAVASQGTINRRS
jgi:hypothetical protein